MRIRVLVLIVISFLMYSTSFGQLYIEGQGSKVNITKYIANFLQQDSVFFEITRTRCEKGMNLFSFSISNDSTIYGLTTSYKPNYSLNGFVKQALKSVDKISYPSNLEWSNRRFLLPIIYEFGCKGHRKELVDKSFESLYLLQNFEFQPDNSLGYEQEIPYRDFIVIRPVIIRSGMN